MFMGKRAPAPYGRRKPAASLLARRPGAAMMAAMEPRETVTAETSEVSCDGGEGALGHPRVYLHMGADGTLDCPYCGRHFVLRRADQAAG